MDDGQFQRVTKSRARATAPPFFPGPGPPPPRAGAPARGRLFRARIQTKSTRPTFYVIMSMFLILNGLSWSVEPSAPRRAVLTVTFIVAPLPHTSQSKTTSSTSSTSLLLASCACWTSRSSGLRPANQPVFGKSFAGDVFIIRLGLEPAAVLDAPRHAYAAAAIDGRFVATVGGVDGCFSRTSDAAVPNRRILSIKRLNIWIRLGPSLVEGRSRVRRSLSSSGSGPQTGTGVGAPDKI